MTEVLYYGIIIVPTQKEDCQMSKVKYKLGNGKLAVYESTSYYDPEKKQARPKRKYLGIEDPETGEFIPSTGKRGRRPKANAPEQDNNAPCTDITRDAEVLKLEQEVKSLKEENRALREQNEALRKEISQYRSKINTAISVLSTPGR